MNYDTFLELIRNYSNKTRNVFNFQKYNYYAIVHHSNYIEGSSLSLEDTILLLDENITPNNKSINDTFMAFDHYNALLFILSKANSKEPILVQDIKTLSSLILKNTGSNINCIAGNFDSSIGDFRLLTVRAGTTTFMDYKKVPIYIDKLIKEINSNINNYKNVIDIYHFSFDVHYQFLTIHPFADGNGRLARLMMNYVQQYHNLPLINISIEDKSAYYKSIEKTRQEQNIDYFREFMMQQSIKFLKREISFLDEKDIIVKKNKKGLSFIF